MAGSRREGRGLGAVGLRNPSQFFGLVREDRHMKHEPKTNLEVLVYKQICEIV